MIIHFAHANGIPSDSYSPIFDKLTPHAVINNPKFGHNPEFPVTNNWPFLVDELIGYVRGNSNEPVLAAGHSLGALLSYMAACKQPDLFRGVLMFDPPLIWGTFRWMTKLFKATGQIDRITPAGKSKFRKRQWHSREQAVEYFASKPLFQFEANCFQAFCNAALKPVDKRNANASGEMELEFDVDVELDIFRCTPDNLTQFKPDGSVPMKVIYADQSDASRGQFIEPFARRNGVQCERTRGGHMFPLQRPDFVVERIHQFAEEIQRAD